MIRSAAGTIHLDTSFLIRALDPSYPEGEHLVGWLTENRRVVVSTVAWSEFLCGPTSEREERTAARLLDRQIALGTAEATAAARLFNLGDRRKHSLRDCLIAATAMLDGAALATGNPRDFERFVGAGLVLAES